MLFLSPAGVNIQWITMITAGKRLLLPPFQLIGEKLSKHGLNSICKVEQQGRNSWQVLKALLQIMSQTLAIRLYGK